MKYPFKIIFHDPKRAQQIKHKVQMGHYFVFVKDNEPSSVTYKLKRLLIKGDGKNQVLPLVDKPVQLEGVTITSVHPMIDPISTVVTERDLYRAEQDIVHLFIAFPKAPKNLRLVIKYNGESLTEREVQLRNCPKLPHYAQLHTFTSRVKFRSRTARTWWHVGSLPNDRVERGDDSLRIVSLNGIG